LSQEDTGYFIEARVGISPTRQMTDAIYSHTEGNPFFIAEVVRLLQEQGELVSDGVGRPQPLGIPEGVREVIGRRLNRLSQQCHQTLVTASVIGREFEFRLLSRLSEGTSEEQLLTVMDEALEAHLVEELPGSAEGYQFSHALVQETLASELSAARRGCTPALGKPWKNCTLIMWKPTPGSCPTTLLRQSQCLAQRSW
jgi:predicted ATPase